MPKFISQEDFEYETMCGSTREVFVYGLGHVQWSPLVMTSYRPDTMGNIFSSNSSYHAKYHSVKFEMTVSNSEEYRKALADEIKNAITSGNLVWDPSSGYVKELAANSSVDVSVDEDDMATVSVKEGVSRHTTTVSVQQLMSDIQKLNFKKAGTNVTDVINIDLESRGQVIREADYGNLSREARKLASKVLLVQKPLQFASDRLFLYSKIIAQGGTKLVFPFEGFKGFIPNVRGWVGALPKLGMEFSNTTVVNSAKYLKIVGKSIGWAGVVFGVVDILNNELTISNGLYTGMAVLMLNPYTAPIASGYFITNMVLEFCTDKGIGEHLEETMKRLRPVFIDTHPDMSNYNLIEILELKKNLT